MQTIQNSNLNVHARAKVAFAVAALMLGAGALRAAEVSVNDFSSICGWSTNAVVCAVGDTVVLPAGEYTINNPRVASLSGNTVTALEPGFTGVLDAGSNVGGIIVRPTPGGSGRVFVAILDTDKILGHTENIVVNWNDENSWLCVDGEGGCPNAADDVAMIPTAVDEGSNNASQDYSAHAIVVAGETTVGQIFIGSFKNTANTNTRLQPSNDGDAVLTFSRTDGISPLLAVTGGGAATKEPWVRVKKSNKNERNLSLNLPGGLVVDLGNVGVNTGAPHFVFKNGSLSIPSGKRLLFINGNPNNGGTSDGTEYGIIFEKDYVLSGQGVIRNDSDMHLRVNSEGEAIFKGTWESGGKRGQMNGEDYPFGAGIDFRKMTAEGCSIISDGGFTVESDPWAYNAIRFQYFGSAGIKIGSGRKNSHTGLAFYPDRLRNVGPVLLNSGLIGIWPEYSETADADIITSRIDRLTFGLGVSKLHLYGAGSSDANWPTNFVDIVSVAQTNRAQAYVFSSAIWGADNNVATTSNKVKARIRGINGVAINGAIPWMAVMTRRNGLLPALLDEDGFLYVNARVDGVNLSDVVPGSDALVNNASLALASDLKVNTLSVMSTSGRSQYLGEERTLTIHSGALYLWKGDTTIGVEGGAQNGQIVFAAPAYIHTIAVTNNPAKINLPLVAAQGIAFGAPGGVRVTGDQTGIKEELAVNGCRLVLGTTTTAANLDVDIRVSGGFSVLDVQNVNADFLKKHTLTLQDSGNFPAKVNLGSGTYRVNELFIGGRRMHGGTYGSSASAAVNKDDVHFTGTGVLDVGKSRNMVIYLR